MNQIEHEGKLYQIIEWQKPDDSDYAVGEVVYAVYPAKYAVVPMLVVSQGNHRFTPLYWTWGNKFEEIPQPLYVMGIPVLGKPGYAVKMPEIYNKVGDIRNETD